MFEFKKFTVEDSHCGMKVGTDGVLLGAWADIRPGDRVWDVGAGSGVISLMAAQRGAAEVTAFEIDGGACADARANADRTEWGARITVTEGDFAVTASGAQGRPDVIVSNPPFFTESLHSPGRTRAQARHADALPAETIISIAAARLAPGGRLAMIAPAQRLEELEFESRLSRLATLRLTRVITTAGRAPKRVLVEWCAGKAPHQPLVTDLTIRNSRGELTEEYRALTGAYYL